LRKIMEMPFSEILTKNFFDMYVVPKENVWKGTHMQEYFKLTPHEKGSFGEKFLNEYMKRRGHYVERRENSGHDSIVDGIKTEYKFSVSSSLNPDKNIMINHMSTKKDFDRCIFFIMNRCESDCKFLWFTKEDFLILIKEGIFKHQQGGEKQKIDDYVCSGKRIQQLINHRLIKGYNEWSTHTTTLTEGIQQENYQTNNLSTWFVT
jgi:hypothetical protein